MSAVEIQIRRYPRPVRMTIRHGEIVVTLLLERAFAKSAPGANAAGGAV
jgi:hypothetical protein